MGVMAGTHWLQRFQVCAEAELHAPTFFLVNSFLDQVIYLHGSKIKMTKSLFLKTCFSILVFCAPCRHLMSFCVSRTSSCLCEMQANRIYSLFHTFLVFFASLKKM